ncbi:MAG: hypothetical protein AAF483_18365 [Planctomycetota bacterium]
MQDSWPPTQIEQIQENYIRDSGLDCDRVLEYVKATWNFMSRTGLQSSGFDDNPSPESAQRTYQTLIEAYFKQPVAKYQDPQEYVILRQLDERVRRAAEEIGYSPCPQPIVGSVFSHELNASVRPFNDTFLILIRNGLFKYMAALVRTLIPMLKWNGDSLVPDQKEALAFVENNFDAVRPFYDALEGFILNRFEHSLPEHSYFEGKMFYHFARLRSSIWSFIFAHEYAHVLSRDHDRNQEIPEEYLGIIANTSDALTRAHFKEHRADVVAFELMNYDMVNYMRSSFEHSTSSVCIFFSGIDLFYRTLGELLGIELSGASESHPGPIDRWQYLAWTLQGSPGDQDRIQNAINVGIKCADVVEVLFACNAPLIKRLQPHRKKIAQAWFAHHK